MRLPDKSRQHEQYDVLTVSLGLYICVNNTHPYIRVYIYSQCGLLCKGELTRRHRGISVLFRYRIMWNMGGSTNARVEPAIEVLHQHGKENSARRTRPVLHVPHKRLLFSIRFSSSQSILTQWEFLAPTAHML